MAKLIIGNQDTYATAALVRDLTPDRFISYVVDSNGKLIKDPNTDKIMDFTGVSILDSQYMFYGAYEYNQNIHGFVDMSSIKDISGQYTCYSMFKGCNNIDSVDLSSLEKIGNISCGYMFYDCANLGGDLDLSNLVSITSQSCESMFYNTNISSVNMGSIIKAADYCLQSMFSQCKNLKTADLHSLIMMKGWVSCSGIFSGANNLESINLNSLQILDGGYCFSSGLSYTKISSVSFPKLEYINGEYCLSQCFAYCPNLTDIYFPSLGADSFGESDRSQFENLLQDVSDCTIHFPTNYNPTDPNAVFDITTLYGYPSFGGYNTVLVFDQTPPTVSKVLDFSGITEVTTPFQFSQFLSYNSYYTKIDLSNLVSASGDQAFSYFAYASSSITEIDLSSLTTVSGPSVFASSFTSCTNLTSVDLSSLTTVSGANAFESTFNQCSSLTSVDLSSLTSVSGNYALGSMFYSCIGLTSVSFDSLTTLNDYGSLYNMFSQCSNLTSVSFPALTTHSFDNSTGGTFEYFLNAVPECTIHFPSNLQSTIENLGSGYPYYGGYNTTVLFDLPATE